MKMKNKAEEVIKRLKEEHKIYHIKILGNKENKDNAFEIIVHANITTMCHPNEEYVVGKIILDLLKEAEIKFMVIK